MKKLITISTIIFLGFSVYGQITYEATYPNASSNGGAGPVTFGLINLGHNDYKYLLREGNQHLKFYDLNHSLFQTVNLPAVASSQYAVQYFSRSLFDCDSTNIEYLINGELPWHVYIYRTDSTLLFSADSAHGIYVASNSCCFDKHYIVSTPSGTKMTLDYLDSTVKVFSLCGTLPTSISDNELTTIENKLLAVPNPSIEFTKLFYQLPTGIKEGEILIYNTSGEIIKKYKVDRTFNFLNLSTIDMNAGTYYYSLQTKSGMIETKKLLVIK